MKNYIGLFCVCLLASHIESATALTWAETCQQNDGTPIKDGQFCKSNKPISWVAAHGWCHALGGRLASQATACPTVGGGKCPNMKGAFSTSIWFLINKKDGSTKFYRVRTSDGSYNSSTPVNRAVGSASGETSTYGGISDMYALCEEIPTS